MAPRRNNSGHAAIEVQNFLGLELDTMENFRNSNNNNNNHLSQNGIAENYTRCCVPTGDCFKINTLDFGLIQLNDLKDCVRVICNNEQCTAGQYMHHECFEAWEEGVLTYLKSIGRARSWSDRQRQQNLWTKKGYDLVFKACGCKCGRGHLKKDLDWSPPPTQRSHQLMDDEAAKKKKKRNRNNQKPSLTIATNAINAINTSNNNNNNNNNNHHFHGTNLLESSPVSTHSSAFNAMVIGITENTNHGLLNDVGRHRTASLSSSIDGCISPPAGSTSSDTFFCSPIELMKKEKSKVEAYSERVRTTSGCNGIFSRRLDFSIFNMLPRTRLNSYQIKMEDEGNHGNDETRLFILSSLAQHQKSRVSCVLCEESMLVFDRYPLVDGTFFLSPKQHAPGCIEVKYEGQTQYLTALCMGCLEGVSVDRIVRCRFCSQKWNGSSLVLGTMYAYDIFAAMPCCPDRLTCNSCFKLLLYPHQRLNFFSDYSHVVSCIHCTTQDTHFVKPLSYCYTKQTAQMFNQWP